MQVPDVLPDDVSLFLISLDCLQLSQITLNIYKGFQHLDYFIDTFEKSIRNTEILFFTKIFKNVIIFHESILRGKTLPMYFTMSLKHLVFSSEVKAHVHHFAFSHGLIFFFKE